MRKILLALLGLTIFVGLSTAVRAQSEGKAELSLVDAQGFPTVAALLDVFDAQGQPVTGLQPEDLTILEDGIPHPVTGLTVSTPPAQIVVAVNPGPALAVRDAEGIERFERVSEVVAGWARARSLDNPDDLSLITIAGPLITHAEPDDFAVSITSFKPDFQSTTPNVQSLVIALNTVNETTPLPGMKRAILLITPHTEEPNIDLTLSAVAEQALDSKVRIFVWLIDADLYFNSPSAIAFKALALQTGGSYFAYSGKEPFPDLESYFAPLRHLYSLSYDSMQTTSGEHLLAVDVQTASGKITSNNYSFSLDVQPPNPILVVPPGQIVRQAPPDDPFNAEMLLPLQQELEIIIEFPDNHPRPLTRTTLYIDGIPVAQNDTEPFDQFIWDLSQLNENGVHELVVEAVDSLGLSKASMVFPITVTVIQPPTGAQAFLTKYRTWVAFGAIMLAGGTLAYILYSARLRPKPRGERQEARKRRNDPVTQPVAIPQAEAPTKGNQARRLPWIRPGKLQDAPAYLMEIGSEGEPLISHPIPLVEKETILGTDPTQVKNILDHPSIAALHARLHRMDGNDYLLVDNDTVAGTWVNYDPIPKEGRILKHGDMIHFGKLMYRFELKKPPAEIEPTITFEVPSE